MAQVITANRLVDGEAVFRMASGEWHRDIQRAEVIALKPLSAEAEAAALADGRVLDVAVIDVVSEEGKVVPVRLRERIRAFGPTIDYAPRPRQAKAA